MSEPHCYNLDCRIFNSCKYLKNRFNTTECIPTKGEIINKKHKEELKEREEMLKSAVKK